MSAARGARLAALAALAALLALGGAGCFASWGAVQLSGSPRLLEEGAREVSVPLPGVRELLAVNLPLTLAVERAPAGSEAAGAAEPFALACEATQAARDQVHRSAFRYGKKWRYATAAMFVLEAAVAAAYFFSDREAPEHLLAAGVLGLDALGTAALFFAPRKEIFRAEERPISSRVRGDCPDGLALDVGGELYPVDAAGRVGELGVAALDAWMQAPGAPLRVTYAGRTADVPVGLAEQCAWNRSHHPDRPELVAGCPLAGSLAPRLASARLEVPMGTLTRLEPEEAP